MGMEIIVLSVLATAFLAVGFALGVACSFGDLKAENERLNQKLQRNNPRDAHGRFTKDK